MIAAEDRRMIRLSTDFNTQEDGAIVLPADAPADAQVPGARVILFKPEELECEAIVRRGTAWPWVAKIVPRTQKCYGGALPLGYPDAPRGWPMERGMLRVQVDFNHVDDGDAIGLMEKDTPPQVKVVGTRIILCASDLECEAIVRRGKWSEWAADIVLETLKDIDEAGVATARFPGPKT
jgi:hypothetical protein